MERAWKLYMYICYVYKLKLNSLEILTIILYKTFVSIKNQLI